MAVTPFLPVQEAAKLNVRKWTDIQPENNEVSRIIPQLMGNEPAHFVDTVRALQSLGYQRVNWNIGCPAAQVVRKQRGCGVMPFPDRVEAVVQRVTAETDCLFSVKMRLGLRNPREGVEILRRLQDYPLDFIVIHPRLGVQQYEGSPDWDGLAKCCDSAGKQRIVYSGDIVDLSSFQRWREAFPQIGTCMLGRGLLRNIFLAEELCAGTELSREQRRMRFSKFYADYVQTMLAQRGPHASLSALKELWHYFASFFQLSESQLLHLLRQTDWESFHQEATAIVSAPLD